MFGKKKKKKSDWIPPPLKPTQLEFSATKYLEKFMSTREQLRRVLMRKAHKNWQRRGALVTLEEKEQVLDLIEKEIQKWVDQGAIQEERVAALWTEHLQNKGKSSSQIRQKLSEKGLSQQHIAKAMENLEDSAPNFELESAIAYARKRQFGAFNKKKPELHGHPQQKEIAAMMRVGHRYDLVRSILNCDSVDAVDELLDNSFDD